MLADNEKNQLVQAKLKEEQKQADINAQKAYARMLDQQAQDRQNEIAARERRA